MSNNKIIQSECEIVYLENRYETPKEQFVNAIDYLDIGNKLISNDKQLLDIGCATGEFLYFVRKVNSKIVLNGIDYSSKLVEKAKDFLKNYHISIAVGDANNLSNVKDNTYDFVTSFGTISYFDDFRPSFNEIIRVANKNSKCLILMLLNELDMDVLIKFLNKRTGLLEDGWNKFSIESVSNYLGSRPEVKNLRLIKHRMSSDIPKNEDNLIRTWTIKNEKGERMEWNGLNMEISLYNIIFDVSK